jgi:anti-sigma B factor antagonist
MGGDCMDISVSYLEEHDVHLIKLRGRMDSYYSSELENSIEPVLRKANKIVFECSEVPFLSSAGIRVFLSLMNRLKRRGGGLVLLNLQETAKKVLRTSKTLDLFPHTDDPKKAVRLLEGKK